MHIIKANHGQSIDLSRARFATNLRNYNNSNKIKTPFNLMPAATKKNSPVVFLPPLKLMQTKNQSLKRIHIRSNKNKHDQINYINSL